MDLTRGGAKGTRTPNPLLAKQVRYQLRHGPGSRGPIPECGPADPRCYVMRRGHTNAGNFTLEKRLFAISRSTDPAPAHLQ